MKLPKESQFFEIVLNILGYREESEWVALALEMDLRGYGATWEDALSELRDLIFMQISFAHSKGRPEMIFRSADPVWFQLFADHRRAKFERQIMASSEGKDDLEPDYQTGGLSLPPTHVIAKTQNGFSLSDA